jgi:hypothetical protein
VPFMLVNSFKINIIDQRKLALGQWYFFHDKYSTPILVLN